ncbi:YggT family protein [Spirabiliibacterium falconis]|uniref:YggT family protein n=1 Tax=Spirabiliibacterium falconis TaxID=572023 RepID=UPI001AAD7766|nr:YggT family protein [Spirabiliibacterium falconis]MBE2894347.1 YggT family protein [Spirabiliibacterium falconis]
MNTLPFLLQTVIGLYTIVLLLRAWFQFCRVDFYNPLSQTVVKLTQPVLAPLRKVIPTKHNLDFAAIVLAFGLNIVLYAGLNSLSETALPWSSIAIISAFSLLKTFGKIVFWAIFIRAVLSWFSRGQHPLDYLLYQISEPLLTPIRRILPNTGMIDFAPMVLAFALILANNLLLDIFGILWFYA